MKKRFANEASATVNLECNSIAIRSSSTHSQRQKVITENPALDEFVIAKSLVKEMSANESRFQKLREPVRRCYTSLSNRIDRWLRNEHPDEEAKELIKRYDRELYKRYNKFLKHKYNFDFALQISRLYQELIQLCELRHVIGEHLDTSRIDITNNEVSLTSGKIIVNKVYLEGVLKTTAKVWVLTLRLSGNDTDDQMKEFVEFLD